MINSGNLEYFRSKAIEYYRLINDEISAKRYETMSQDELINEAFLEAAASFYASIKRINKNER